MNPELLARAPKGPAFLDLGSMSKEYDGLQTRVLNAATAMKHLQDRHNNLFNQILQLRSCHMLHEKIELPYIPRHVLEGNIRRIQPLVKTTGDGMQIVMEPEPWIKYGMNEEGPFMLPNAFLGFDQMTDGNFVPLEREILEAPTGAKIVELINRLATQVPSISNLQLSHMIRALGGHEERMYAALVLAPRCRDVVNLYFVEDAMPTVAERDEIHKYIEQNYPQEAVAEYASKLSLTPKVTVDSMAGIYDTQNEAGEQGEEPLRDSEASSEENEADRNAAAVQDSPESEELETLS